MGTRGAGAAAPPAAGPGLRFSVTLDHPQYSLLDFCDSFVVNYRPILTILAARGCHRTERSLFAHVIVYK